MANELAGTSSVRRATRSHTAGHDPPYVQTDADARTHNHKPSRPPAAARMSHPNKAHLASR
eukprot:360256-Chlamydomonas_euryale.AAC.1